MPPPAPQYSDHREHVDLFLHAALDAANPGAALRRTWPADLVGKRCAVLAAGKASAAMLAGALPLTRVSDALALVIPGSSNTVRAALPNATVLEIDHPLPTPRNVAAAQRALQFIADARAAHARGAITALLLLLSGGASAHLTLPAPGLALDDIRALTAALLHAGAPIQDLNAVRKHLELLKGGGLMRLAAPMPVWTLILSDVIGDDLSSIASGPTCADPTTFADALGVLARYGVRTASPAATRFLEEGAAGTHPETLKPGDPALRTVHHRIIGNNDLSLDAVANRARTLGFRVLRTHRHVHGEARDLARRLAAAALLHLPTRDTPACILAGGETTVTVTGPGKGGRNQELALAAALEIDAKGPLALASFSTDGVDGPTDAAGAVVSADTLALARRAGLDAPRALADNDSYTLLDRLGALIRTGPTGTNVNDVSVALVY